MVRSLLSASAQATLSPRGIEGRSRPDEARFNLGSATPIASRRQGALGKLTKVMAALERLDALLADRGRQAVLPRGLQGSRSAARRAIRRRCDDGTLVRIARGVYARRKARLFDVVPEVLPKLGFWILPRPAASNLNFKSGGNVWRVGRPCRRLLVKHGVAAAFESPSGKLYETGSFMPTPMHVPPSREETDRHFASFDR